MSMTEIQTPKVVFLTKAFLRIPRHAQDTCPGLGGKQVQG